MEAVITKVIKHLRSGNKVLGLAVYGLLCAGISGRLEAQTTTATIEGVVTDPSGAVVVGAKVDVEGANGIRTFSTDQAGSYRASGLLPGRYAVTATLAPFPPRRVEGVEVAINRTATLDLKLELARQAERVEVRAPLRTLDPSRSSVSHVVTAREIDTIPLNGRNYLDLVLLTPGTIASNSRTDLADRDTRGAIFGERAGNAAFLIDGFDNSDDVRGGVFQSYTQDAVQEFEVIGAGYKAEFGRGSGGVINVITKSGGNELTGTGAFFVRNDRLDASNVEGAEAPDLARYNSSVVLGGPVTRNRAWYFGSFEHLFERREPIFPTTIPVELSRGEDFSSRPTNNAQRLFGKYTRRTSDTQDMRIETGWSRVASAHQLIGTNALPSASNDSDTESALTGFGHRYFGGQRLILDSSLTYRDQRYDLNPDLGPGFGTQVTLANLGTFYVGPRYDLKQKLDQRYINGRVVGSLFSGNHNAKAGIEYLHTAVDGSNGQGLANLVNTTLANFRLFDVQSFSIPQGTAFLNPGDELTRMRNHGASVFVQDDWRPIPRLTLNLGLRYDYDSKFDDANNLAPRLGVAWSIDESTVARASWGVFYDRYRLGLAQAVPELGGYNGKTVVEFDFPRLAADALAAPGTLGFVASVTQDPYAIHKQFGIPNTALVSRDTIQSLTGMTPDQFVAALNTYVRGVLGASALPVEFSPLTGYLRNDMSAGFRDQVRVATPFKTPFNRTFTVGLERRLFSDVTAEATYVGRSIRNVLGLRIPNLSPEARVLRRRGLTTDGGPLQRTYGPWYDGNYDGIVLALQKPFDGRYQWQVSYTYSEGDDNLLNPNLAFGVATQGAGAVPNDNLDLEFDRGNSDLVTSHVVVASSTVSLPFTMLASALVRGTSGQFFSAVSTTPREVDYDGVLTSRPVTTVRNQFTGPATLNVDVRLEKRFAVGGMTASALIECFNLFNARNPRAIENTYTATGPVATFGDVKVPYPGREAQIGFRLTF